MELADDGEDSGPEVVALADALSFDGVREAIEAIAGQLAQAWEKVKPSEAKVELGLQITAKSGKLSALIVDGGADASLKLVLTWKAPTTTSN